MSVTLGEAASIFGPGNRGCFASLSLSFHVRETVAARPTSECCREGVSPQDTRPERQPARRQEGRGSSQAQAGLPGADRKWGSPKWNRRAITSQKQENELSEPAHWEPCSLGDG